MYTNLSNVNPGMRLLTATVTIVAVLALQVGCSRESDAPASPSQPDLIVYNADIHTSDSTSPGAEAFAVSEGKFVAIGTSGEIRKLAGPDTQLVDASGVTIIPGLIDGHTHLVSGSGLAVGVDLSGIEDKNEWLQLIRDKSRMLKDGDWILGGAWDHNLSDGVLPTKELLDSVAPDNPVLLRDIDGHSAWANSLAIELAGIGADSTVPPGGEIMVDADTGEPTGIFLESAGYLFRDAPGLNDARDPVAGITAAVELANSLGITGVHDMSGEHDAFLSVLDNGDLTLRVWQGSFTRRVEGETPAQVFERLGQEKARVAKHVETSGFREKSGPLLEIAYAKFMVDGVLSTYTALMKEPYADNPTAHAEPFVSREELQEMVSAAHAAGFPVAIHAIGDEAVSWVLDAFAASPGARGMLPDRVEHIEVVTPDDIRRFEALGVVASMQPNHATCCVGNYVIDRIGRQRLPNAYAWRSMLDNEVPLVLGSDWPTSPLDPLIQIGNAMQRETRIDGVVRAWDENQTLGFGEALHSYTQAGADMTSWSDRIGSISVGKWADFVLLDARLPDPVPTDIADRQVAATYFAGRQVYPKQQ